MRVGKLATVVGVIACALGAGSAALAASTPKGGKIRLFVTNTSATNSKILITGAIGDFGTAVSENGSGKVDRNGEFEKVTLRHGGFIINVTPLNKKLGNAKLRINHATCSILFSATGPATIGNGTGAYAGITGKVAITITFAGVARKTAKGCAPGPGGRIGGSYQSTTGTGSVSFE